MILTVCANPSVDSFWAIGALQKGIVNRSQKETFYPGGKGIHTAYALRELGKNVTTLGIWGGLTGQWLKKQCQQKNITTIGPETEEWTRVCIAFQSDSDWNETEILGHGPSINDTIRKAFRTTYKRYIESHDIEAIIISGSVPQGFENNLYHQLVEEAKLNEIPTFVDASGPLLRQTLSAHPFGIHINQKEGKDLYNLNDPVAIATKLREYCELAAVTAGKDGLYMSFNKNLFHASHKVDANIFSTIGSGDCLLAGLCMAYLTRTQPAYWAQFATACGSANCIHPHLGMLKAKDVNNIVDQVNLKKLYVQ